MRARLAAAVVVVAGSGACRPAPLHPASESATHVLRGVENAAFGSAVSVGPDVDGDGVPDVAVAAPAEAVGPLEFAGRVRLHSGRTGELLASWAGGEPFEHFGASVALGPDVDGDGRGDVLVGTCLVTEHPRTLLGRAFLYSGATGQLLRRWEGEVSPVSADVPVCPPVVLGPDVDGDGGGDVLLATFGDARLHSGATGALLRSWPTTAAPASALSLGPDVDGDGRADVLLATQPCDGVCRHDVCLYAGATGAEIRCWRFGEAVDSAELGPDADGDGLGDVVIALRPELGAGEVRLYAGRTGVLLRRWPSPAPPPLTGNSIETVAELGPDADGDGLGDVLIGHPFAGPGAFGCFYGQVVLYSGVSGSTLAAWDGEEGSVCTPGGRTYPEGDRFGGALDLGPDLDGDALADAVVGGAADRVYILGSRLAPRPSSATTLAELDGAPSHGTYFWSFRTPSLRLDAGPLWHLAPERSTAGFFGASLGATWAYGSVGIAARGAPAPAPAPALLLGPEVGYAYEGDDGTAGHFFEVGVGVGLAYQWFALRYTPRFTVGKRAALALGLHHGLAVGLLDVFGVGFEHQVLRHEEAIAHDVRLVLSLDPLAGIWALLELARTAG